MEGVGTLKAKKALGAPELREKWCKCCDEFGIMISEEVRTNPRYRNIKSHWNDE